MTFIELASLSLSRAHNLRKSGTLSNLTKHYRVNNELSHDYLAMSHPPEMNSCRVCRSSCVGRALNQRIGSCNGMDCAQFICVFSKLTSSLSSLSPISYPEEPLAEYLIALNDVGYEMIDKL